MSLSAAKIGLIVCGKHPLVVTMIQVIDPGHKGHPVFLSGHSHVLYKIIVNKEYNTMQVIIMSSTHPRLLDVVNSSKYFSECHVIYVYQITRKVV